MRNLLHLLRCRRGASALVLSVSLLPIMGLVGLGTEAGMWYAVEHEAQNAADSAAFAGALTLAGQTTVSISAIQASGKQFAAQNGFCATGDTTTYTGSICGGLLASATQAVTITPGHWNGSAFSATGSTNAVKAVTQQTQPTMIAQVFNVRNITMTGTAIAFVKPLQNPCVLALSSTGSISFHDNGTAVTAPNCAMTSDGTFDFKNLKASNLSIGAMSSTGGCTGNSLCNNVLTYEPPVADPLASLNSTITSLTIPTTCSALVPYATGHCVNKNFSVSKATTLTTGGVYFFSGTFSLTGNGSISTAAGVTASIVLLPGSSLRMTGNTAINVTAPTTVSTGDVPPGLSTVASLLDGVAVFDPESGSVTVNGNNTNTAFGAFYFPNAQLTFGGNSSVTTSCLEVIASSVQFSGSSSFVNSGCPSTLTPQLHVVSLVQ